MINKQFEKEAFKKSVRDNVKFLYRKRLEEATQEQLFQAVCYTVKDVIIDNWLESQNAFEEQDPKIVYYMSMEFLMGRALGNNHLQHFFHVIFQFLIDPLFLHCREVAEMDTLRCSLINTSYQILINIFCHKRDQRSCCLGNGHKSCI